MDARKTITEIVNEVMFPTAKFDLMPLPVSLKSEMSNHNFPSLATAGTEKRKYEIQEKNSSVGGGLLTSENDLICFCVALRIAVRYAS